MWRDLGWGACTALGGLLPLAILFWFEGAAFDRAALALLGLAVVFGMIVYLIWLRFMGAIVREATRGLGPDATLGGTGLRPSWPRRLSPMERAIRSAVLRFDRNWREHAGHAEARLAAAVVVIAAVPDPLILALCSSGITRMLAGPVSRQNG